MGRLLQGRSQDFSLGGGVLKLGGEDRRGPKPEVRRAESGEGVLGEGQPALSPPARGSGERFLAFHGHYMAFPGTLVASGFQLPNFFQPYIM